MITASSADADLPIGATVGEYTIDSVLGRGGFGTVYRGVHPVIGKHVAIKVLARKFAADESVISRFAAEARAVNQINHSNIIDIFQFSQLPDGRHYYVMECLEGETLDAHLRSHGPVSLHEALPILRAIGRALDAAHAKGIAHRDLKPENIFLARDADGALVPKLLDFGIAKLLGEETGDVRHRTATGVPIGTPYYMSPEQCRGKDVDHRTDVYAFGIVAYRMLTGAYPFEGDDHVELLFKQVNEEAPPPSSRHPALPATVDAAIAWMLRKDPAQRPKSLGEALAAFADVDGVQVAGPIAAGRLGHKSSPGTPVVAKAPRRAAVWIGSGLVLVAGVMLWVKAPPKPDSLPRAPERAMGSAQPAIEPAPPPPMRPSGALNQAVTTAPGEVGRGELVELTFVHLAPAAQIIVDGEAMDPPVRVSAGDAHTIEIRTPGMVTLVKKIKPSTATTIDAAQHHDR